VRLRLTYGPAGPPLERIKHCGRGKREQELTFWIISLSWRLADRVRLESAIRWRGSWGKCLRVEFRGSVVAYFYAGGMLCCVRLNSRRKMKERKQSTHAFGSQRLRGRDSILEFALVDKRFGIAVC
jgi:hypothetical protein